MSFLKVYYLAIAGTVLLKEEYNHKKLLDCVCKSFFFSYEMPFTIIMQLEGRGREGGRETFIDWSRQGSKQVTISKNSFLYVWVCVGVGVDEGENGSVI